MDREWNAEMHVDRRNPDARREYKGWFARLMVICTMSLAVSTITLATLLWNVLQDKAENKYLNCVSLAAQGVKEPNCDAFAPYIEAYTNAFRAKK